MSVHKKLVIEGLSELAATPEAQVKRWSEKAGGTNSLVEAIEWLFDDSGLDVALAGGPVFSEALDADLRHLSAVLDRVDPYMSLADVADDAELASARAIATRVLAALESE